MPSQLPSPPTDKMRSLMDLPDELLEQIIFDVADQDRKALYYDVIYVNKRLNRIASPHVARHFPILLMDPNVPANPTHLLLHLFRHPGEAANVKTLITDSSGMDYTTHGAHGAGRLYFRPFTDVEILARIAKVAQVTCPELSNSSEWCLGLRNNSVDATVALLLAWCTKIVRLDYRLHPFCPDLEQSMTLRLISIAVKNMIAGTQPLHPLAHLEHVVLRTQIGGFPIDIAYAAPFFYLPKLKYFATIDLSSDYGPLRDVNDDGPSFVQGTRPGVALDRDIYISQFPIGTSPIETLILNIGDIWSTGFLVLVRACERLKTLGIRIGSYPEPSLNIRETEKIEDLGKAIAHHSSSLEEVTLRLVWDPRWRDYHHYHQNIAPLALFDCLKDMQRLKRLVIHLELLFSRTTPIMWDTRVVLETNRLPPTLEHLVLERHAFVDQDLMHGELFRYRILLHQCGPGKRFSKLQSLTLPFCIKTLQGRPFQEEVQDLEVLAAKKGVQVIFRGRFEWNLTSLAPEPYPLYRREQSNSRYA